MKAIHMPMLLLWMYLCSITACTAQPLVQESAIEWSIELDLSGGESVHSLVVHPNTGVLYAIGSTPESGRKKNDIFFTRVKGGKLLSSFTFGQADSNEVLQQVFFDPRTERFQIIGSIESRTFVMEVSEKGEQLHRLSLPIESELPACKQRQFLPIGDKGYLVSGEEQGQAVLTILDKKYQLLRKRIVSSAYLHHGAYISQLGYIDQKDHIIVAINGENKVNRPQSVLLCIPYAQPEDKPEKPSPPEVIPPADKDPELPPIAALQKASLKLLATHKKQEMTSATPQFQEKGMYHFPQPRWKVGQGYQLALEEVEGKEYYIYIISVDAKYKAVQQYPFENLTPDPPTLPYTFPSDKEQYLVELAGNEYLIMLVASQYIPDINQRLTRLGRKPRQGFAQHFSDIFGDILVPHEKIEYASNELSIAWESFDYQSVQVVPCILELNIRK